MQKRGICIFICILVISLFSIVGVVAQENTSCASMGGTCCSVCSGGSYISGTECNCCGACETAPSTDTTSSIEISAEHSAEVEKIFEEYKDAELQQNAGITPDSAFYIVDKFFDNFKDKMEVREERVAEMKELVEAGNIEVAKESLEEYKILSEKVEQEVNPEQRDEAVRSAAAIRNTVDNFEEDIPEKEREEFVYKVKERENSIATAAEIAAKINELCAQLALLDPIQFEDTCKIKDNSPKWMKKQFQQLTIDQQEEAKKFGEIITQCFQTSGKQCRCGDISFYEFSVFCEKMSSLSVKCDEGDENSCIEMQSAEMPELPEHLKIIFNEIQGDIGKSKFEKNIPQECVNAEATPEKCTLIMTEINSPPECRTAIKEAAERGELKGELDGNKLCHEIMFKLYAPQECADAGATTPDECAKIMFKINMPQECIDAGFDGQYSSDEKNCKELMKKGQYYGGGGCVNIIDEQERLKCFEGAVTVINDVYGYEANIGAITWQCQENKIFNSTDCNKFMTEIWPKMEQQRQLDIQKTVEQRQVYVEYAQGGQKCPDGTCDYAEKNGFAYCPEDCGGERTNTCGYNCWLEGSSCVCKTTPIYGQDCGYGCWWNSGLNKCECGTTTISETNCGYNCWWQTDHCECSNVQPARQECGYGCWWDSAMNSCKCAPVPTTPTGQTCGYNCWWQTDHCECSKGCQCSWGWSDTCNCQSAPVIAGCQCSCGWSPTCNCGTFCTTGGTPVNVTTCASKGGTCCTACSSSGPYISGTECNCCGACQATTCPSNSYTTSTGACNTATCPNGCHYNSNGCPDSCTTSGGYCGDNICSGTESPTSCPSDCGTLPSCPSNAYTVGSNGCNTATCPNGCNIANGCPTGCITTSISTCASKGGTCCTACSSSGPYISGTECNCCGACQTASTPSPCTCADGYYSATCDCSGHTAPVGVTCASMGGTCCSVCSGGSYISGTECNCCGACQVEPPITGGFFWDYWYE